MSGIVRMLFVHEFDHLTNGILERQNLAEQSFDELRQTSVRKERSFVENYSNKLHNVLRAHLHCLHDQGVTGQILDVHSGDSL